MNFYKHHIGDYAQATAHLTFVEDAAYSRLLRKYYAEETPLPVDIKVVQRLVGARAREEREAVQAVLDEFFVLEADGWHNKRADKEIASNRELDDDREARQQNERERQRRHRDERKRLFEGLRDLDLVPPFDTKTEALREMLRNAQEARTKTRPSRPVTPLVTRDVTANQTPDARHQTPSSSEPIGSAQPPAALSPKDRIWAIGIGLLGDGGRPFLGKTLKTYGETVLLEVLSEASTVQPAEAKSWIVGACEARKRPLSAGTTRDLLDREPRPPWVVSAGFGDIFEAESAGCGPGNADKFRNGRRVAA